MNTIDIRERKEQLQKNISVAMSDLVEEFKAETGVSPTSVHIDMLPLGEKSLGNREFVVGDTTVFVKI